MVDICGGRYYNRAWFRPGFTGRHRHHHRTCAMLRDTGKLRVAQQLLVYRRKGEVGDTLVG